MLRLALLSGAVALAATGSGGTAPTAAALASSGCHGAWQVLASPNRGANDNRPLAVAARSGQDAWLVGEALNRADFPRTLIEHWDGTAWRLVRSANVGPSANALAGVAALSANDAWAVGFSTAPTGHGRTLIEHWNGVSWSVVRSPNVGTLDNGLTAVAPVSASDVWAVGSFVDASGAQRPLVEHWRGRAWSVVPAPGFGARGAALFAVSAVSRGAVWAVGRHGAAHFAEVTLIERWDGVRWRVVASPSSSPSFNQLAGVSALDSADVWAAGIGGGTLAEHWNGRRWAVVPTPHAGAGFLSGIVAVSSQNVWSVGSAASRTLTEHWAGKSWTTVSSPSPGTAAVLSAVAAASAGPVWAVGFQQGSGGIQHTLVERHCA